MKNKANLNNKTGAKKLSVSVKFHKTHLATLGLLGGAVALSSLNVSCSRKSQVQEDKKKLELVGYDFTQDGLFKAAAQDNLQALKIFKDNKFDLGIKDLLGRTAVHAAADAGATRALNFLSDNGVNLEALDKAKKTPLMLAAAKGQVEAISFLLKNGVATTMRDKQKKFALLYAIDGDSDQAIRLIAPHNRELLDTALLYASDQNKPNAIEPLVQYGASVYSRSQGLTSLMIAAMKGHDVVAQKLLLHGANAYAVSEEGKLARDYANGNEKVLAALTNATAPTEEDGELALEWNDKELENVVKNAMERYHESEIETLNKADLATTNTEDEEKATASVPTPPRPPADVTVTSISGKTLPIKAASPAELSMAGYAEKPLPLIMHATEPGKVEIQDLRNAEAEPVPIEEGNTIAMTGLKVTKIKKRIVNSKMTGGLDKELVTLMVQDEKTGKTREIYSGYESTAADAVAVVRLKSTGEHLIVRRGDVFTDANGTGYKVADVNQLEIVVENAATGEVTLLPLLGIKH